MADNGGGGGFGWGFFVGGVLGLVAGAYLASGPGREQVDALRSQTIELTGAGSPFGSRARAAVQEGIAAARRRRTELEAEESAAPAPQPSRPTPEPTTES